MPKDKPLSSQSRGYYAFITNNSDQDRILTLVNSRPKRHNKKLKYTH